VQRELLLSALVLCGCQRTSEPKQVTPTEAAPPMAVTSTSASSEAESAPPTTVGEPQKVDVTENAMGTKVRIIAYTNPQVNEARVRKAIQGAMTEVRRLEDVMTTWRPSEITKLDEASGEWVNVSPDTLDVLEKSIWAGKTSKGTFDITFASLGNVWRFGDAAEANPKPPSKVEVDKKRKLIDYTKIEVDRTGKRARIGKGQHIDLGGIAKGYAVDGAARLLKSSGVEDFLVQAGGDLYGSGKKPDGTPWVSGVRDPRGPDGSFFAMIELANHAFSTAGDYARSYVYKGKRYHHIIDPRTGFPATACRSVTIWAPTAFEADAIDDAVFILGPKEGLELVESLEGVGAVIVDAKNAVHVSKRLEGKIRQVHPPTDGI
jgi:thiamine biosynthesis lipoprotein